jgi:multiple sugar transport system substrate-binding protein
VNLRVALVAGPMYDHLYRQSHVFDPASVDVVVHADHPTLNKAVAEMLGKGERLDLIATHSKYAPSQAQWLQPLDSLLEPRSISALAPLAVELCRYRGKLLSVPRLIDVRILWVRSDRVAVVPSSWRELVESDVLFGFPGRESGLFGTFFELVVGMGGRLFDDDGQPCFDSPEAIASIELLCRLGSRGPSDLPTWHYDEVDQALLSGQIDAVGAWPGGWGSISKSPLADVLTPHLYPSGPQRRVSYAGCHSWAIPTTCGNLPGALQLLTELIGFETQSLDATGGTICAHSGALAAVEPINEVDHERLAITQATIADSMITYPQMERFPLIEDAGWAAINSALRGEVQPTEAARLMQTRATEILAKGI